MPRDPWDDIAVQDAMPTAPAPLPAAVIRHEGAPAGDHFDVLLAVRTPSGDDDRACATWRAAHDPAALPPGSMLAVEPIPAHRARYLRLDAPEALSGGRGTAVPVRHGSWRTGRDGALEFSWDDGTRTRVAPESMTLWRIA